MHLSIAVDSLNLQMNANHLRELIELEEGYWWHVAKRRLVVELLQRNFAPPGMVIEGGVGSARNLVEFRKLGYEAVGLDVMEEAVANARERGIEDVRRHDIAEPWPVEPHSARAVILLDVLEHTPDPVVVLKHAARAIRPDGGIIVTVPAYPMLYSDWDRRLGHYRRYTKRALVQQARKASLRPVQVGYWNAFTLPAAVACRGYRRLFPGGGSDEFPRVSPRTNDLLLGCARAERWLSRRMPIPFGLSLAAVLAREPGET
jgi:SAM-dependent methyltransferase